MPVLAWRNDPDCGRSTLEPQISQALRWGAGDGYVRLPTNFSDTGTHHDGLGEVSLILIVGVLPDDNDVGVDGEQDQESSKEHHVEPPVRFNPKSRHGFPPQHEEVGVRGTPTEGEFGVPQRNIYGGAGMWVKLGGPP